MDVLIGFVIGSIVSNIAQSSKQSGGTVAEEKKAVETIVQSKLKYPHIGRYINSFVDRVQPKSNEALQELVISWDTEYKTEQYSPTDKEHISNWDTSLITDMSNLFTDMYTFNDDISQWDTSRVTNMAHMFDGASAFNQPIGRWNMSKVTDMSGMFSDARAFNQPIGRWNTSKVTDMSRMFMSTPEWDPSTREDIPANAFNQSIHLWDTRAVKNMFSMFYGAKNFKQNLNAWDISNVTDMDSMFYMVDRIPNWPYSSNRNQPQRKAVYTLEDSDVEEIMKGLREEYSHGTEDTFLDMRTFLQQYESTERYILMDPFNEPLMAVEDLAQHGALYNFLAAYAEEVFANIYT